MKKLLFPLLIFTLLTATVVFVASPAGLRSVVDAASKLSGGAFAAGKTDGRLFSDLRLHNVRMVLPAAEIVVAEMRCSWHPLALLKGQLAIGRLAAGGIVITIKESTSQAAKAERQSPAVLPAALLPLSLDIGSVDIAGLKVVGADGSVATDIRELRMGIGGGRDRLEIREGVVEAKLYGLALSGFVETGSAWNVDVMGKWRISPNGGYAEMGGTYAAKGPLGRLQVDAAANRPADVRVTGVLQGLPGNPSWQARASGSNVWFPVFHEGWPRLMLTATVNAAGDFGSYHGTVDAGGSFLDFDDIVAKAVVSGDGRGLTARTVHLDSPAGIVDVADLVLGWWDAFSWSGEVKTTSFNPSGFDERFEGILTADLTSRGHLGYEDADQLQTETEVRSAEGTVRGFPVAASGRVKSDYFRFDLAGIHLRSGESSLQANGTIDGGYALEFDIVSPDLGEVLPDGEGELTANGRLSGSLESPALDLDLDAAAIRWGGEKIGRLTAAIHADTRPGAVMEATVDGEDIDWAGVAIEQGAARLNGTAETHELSVDLRSAEADLQFALRGGIKDLQWQGSLDDVLLRVADLGDWRQRAPAALALSATNADLAGLCLAQKQGLLCVEANWSDDKKQNEWRLTGRLDDFQLARLSDVALTPWPVAGLLDASLTAGGHGGQIASGEMSVAAPEITIESGLAEEGLERISLRGTALDLRLADEALTAGLQSKFQDRGSLQLEIGIDKVPGISRALLYQPMQGQVRFDVEDLSLIAPLTNFMVRPTGKIASTLAVGGSLSRPTLDGRLDLREGRIAVPAVGISLEKVGVSLAAAGDEVAVEAQARSGPGQATLRGSLGYYDGRGIRGNFAISGRQFQAVSLPEYEILADPDLRFSFDGEKGELGGTVIVPQAYLAPREMKGSVAVSKDVVYTDHEKEEKVADWPLYSKVEVVLGDDVQLEGYGLKGRLSGSLSIDDTPESFTTGKGELALEEGVFSIYGRSLTIERGRVFFSGGPLDNPGIDARAVQFIREKSNLGGDLTIGVNVSGSLQALDFKLFSDPSMDEGDILAYMVVGHSMSDLKEGEGGMLQAAASTIGLGEGAGLVTTLTGLLPVDEMHLEGTEKDGNMALVVGKKLTDRLYIGYDHNFFDQKGAFRASYDLGYGFSVVSRSSADMNAADLFYSIER
jgi:translocation and assembly module TamB